MQLIYVKDLKAAMLDYRNEDLFVNMMENGFSLGRKVSSGLNSGNVPNVDQYVRVSKFYDTSSFQIECNDEEYRLLTLMVYWINAFSSGKGNRVRLNTMEVTSGENKNYLKNLINNYGKMYGLSIFKAPIANGRVFEFIGFVDPRSVTKNDFINIF